MVNNLVRLVVVVLGLLLSLSVALTASAQESDSGVDTTAVVSNADIDLGSTLDISATLQPEVAEDSDVGATVVLSVTDESTVDQEINKSVDGQEFLRDTLVDAAPMISLTVAVTQPSNGAGMVIEYIETVKPVHLVVEELREGMPNTSPVYSGSLTAGSYKDTQIEFITDTLPYTSTMMIVRLLDEVSGDEIVSGTSYLELVLAPQVVIVIDPVQSGDGNQIIVNKIIVRKEITLTVHPESAGSYDLNKTVGTQPLAPGIYENVELVLTGVPYDATYYVVPRNNRGPFEPSPEVLLHSLPVVRSSNFYLDEQVGAGDAVTLTGLSVAQPVTITLLSRTSNTTDTVVGEVAVPVGDHERLQVAIPDSARPITDALFALQIYGSDPITLVHTGTVLIRRTPVLSSTIDYWQYSQGDSVTLTSLYLGQDVAVSLNTDLDNASADDKITTIMLDAGKHTSVPLRIPEATRPTTDTIFWISFDSPSGLAVPPPFQIKMMIQQNASAKPTFVEYEIMSPQPKDGTGVLISRLQARQNLTITLNGEKDGSVDPDDLYGQLSVQPGDYSNLKVDIITSRQPSADVKLWMSIEADDKGSERRLEPVELHFDPYSTVREFQVAGEQEGDGSEFVISALDTSRPVTVSIFAKNPKVDPNTRSIVEESFGPGTYNDLALSLPRPHQVITDTEFWARVFAVTGEPASSIKASKLIVVNIPSSPASTDRIEVADQETNGYSAVVSKVAATDDGWLMVYEELANSQKALVGFGRVIEGETENFEVSFRGRQVPRGAILTVVLHRDTGQLGVLDFPEADPPAMNGPRIVSKSFVLGSPGIQVRDQDSYGDEIVVSETIAAQDSWIVAYDGATRDVLGFAPISRGRSENVVLPIGNSLPIGARSISVVLHRNSGLPDVFEFPEPDSITLSDDLIVQQPLMVTIIPRPESISGIFHDGFVRLMSGVVTIDHVVTPVNGWLVLYCQNESGVETLCGYTKLGAGDHENVEVTLAFNGLVGSQIRAAIYEDKGTIGKLELDGVDSPMISNGEVLETILAFPPPLYQPKTGQSTSSVTLKLMLATLGVTLPLLAFGPIRKIRLLKTEI